MRSEGEKKNEKEHIQINGERASASRENDIFVRHSLTKKYCNGSSMRMTIDQFSFLAVLNHSLLSLRFFIVLPLTVRGCLASFEQEGKANQTFVYRTGTVSS